jgi:predicted kinase
MTRPVLILLCGIPGSGKTTYAEKMKNSYTYHLSSDAIRKELYGDENIQGNPSDVFALMQDRAIMLLNNGFDVIYDATNITRKDRASIITKCPRFAQIECHIIWAPIETCIERDAARERTVGKEVIDRMLKRFQAPYYDEGIDKIRVIFPDGFDMQKYIDDSTEAMRILHDNPHHTLDIYNHCESAYKYIVNNDMCDNIMALAASFHDVGKPYVKAFVNAKGEPSDTAHFYQHQCVGAYMIYGLVADEIRIDVAWLVSTHMAPFLNEKCYKNLPAYLKNSVDLLHEADLAAH